MAEILGTVASDTLNGTSTGDVIHGYHGNDTINGLDGNDVIYGGGSVQQLDTNGIVVTNGTTAHVELESIAEGFHNTVGMYKISSDGAIHSVSVLFSPDGGKGGGQAVYPHTAIDVDLAAGEQLGFFVLGNGYGTGNNTGLLNDKDAQWEMRTADGDKGLIVDADLALWHVDPVTGKATQMAKGEGHEIFHSIGTAENGYSPNPDGELHAVAIVDTKTGTVKLGLEAQKNGGNLSFDDAIITLELGSNNIEGLDDALIPLAGTDDDIIDAGNGDDTVYGQGGNDQLFGGNGSDLLYGGSGADYISGGDGDDDIKGGTDSDDVHGGAGNDDISGGKDADVIYGDGGNDTIFGDTGDDYVHGGGDDDIVLGGEGNDEVYGGSGDDTITGGKGHDTLDGGSGNDDVDADSGDDTIVAGYGNDSYNGGSGIDWIDYSAATTAVDINLHSHTATSDLGTDTIWSVENVIGSAQGDTLTGDKQENHLIGAGGDDWLRGGEADDTLEGGDGSDTYSWERKDVIGQTGTDEFVDIIIGFSSEDILDLSALTEMTGAQSATDVVQVTQSGGNTTVSALNADNGVWVDVAVLTDVTGLTVTTLDTDGQLIL